MIKKVLDYQQQMNLIEAGDRVVVGFSGGADSVCLLLVLEEMKKQWEFSFCAVHVEHGIRGEESLSDAAFAEQFCKEREIPFYMYQVDAPKLAAEEKLSLEEAARKLRYDCFAKAKLQFEGTKIAVAHHGDDNAETMLFHMVRGTGIKGLRGMAAKRDDVIRPLLPVSRREIESYVNAQGCGYCTDSTNDEVKYARNRIRKQIMPELLAVNVRGMEHMFTLSQQLGEVYEYVSKAAWLAGREGLKIICTDEDGVITEIINCTEDDTWEEFFAPKARFLARLYPNWCMDREVIGRMEPVLMREFLYQVLCMAAGSQKDITNVHVANVQQLFGAETGKQTHLPYGLTGVSRYQDVCLKRGDSAPAHGEKPEGMLLPLDMEALGEEEQVLTAGSGERIFVSCIPFDGDCEKIPEKTYTKWFDYDKINGTVFFRNRQQGDYMLINQQGNQKKLKEYFINEKIPKEERDQLLLMADGDHVMWVVGHRISAGYKVTQDTKRILLVRVEKEN